MITAIDASSVFALEIEKPRKGTETLVKLSNNPCARELEIEKPRKGTETRISCLQYCMFLSIRNRETPEGDGNDS